MDTAEGSRRGGLDVFAEASFRIDTDGGDLLVENGSFGGSSSFRGDGNASGAVSFPVSGAVSFSSTGPAGISSITGPAGTSSGPAGRGLGLHARRASSAMARTRALGSL